MEKNNYQGQLQQPLGSGFNPMSTAADVIKGIDLTDKVVIVTGGNTGIGLETTKTLAGAGATVIVPARNVEKAVKNLQEVPNVEIEQMDLMNPSSIAAFTKKFLASDRPLHVLINNAGIMWVRLQRDGRGFESQLATNYFAQFQLVAQLWPALKKAAGARVINVSSYGHQMAPFNFEDPNFEQREYQTLLGYGQSKTASNLFTLELDNRARRHQVRAYSLHPGSIAGTELARDADPELFKQMGFFDDHGNIPPEVIASLKSIPQGAATTVWCATSPMLDHLGGVYCEDSDVAELDLGNLDKGNGLATKGVQPYSLDKDNAIKLWTLTEKMTGISFDPDNR